MDFPFVFWMVVLWLAYTTWRRCERRRWIGSGLNEHGSNTGWYDSSEFYAPRPTLRPKEHESLDEQRSYIESLETRVSELEERLDFTERLLAERREPAA